MSYSTFNEKALSDFISSSYEIEEIIRCNYLLRGMNDTYHVETTKAQFVYRIYRSNWRDDYSVVAFEIELLNHLNANGVGVSRPVMTKNKEYIHQFNAPEGPRFGVLFTFAEGSPLNMELIETCYKFGEEAAKIHLQSTSFRPKNKRPDLCLEYLVEQPLQIIKKHMTHRPVDYDFIMDIGKKLSRKVEDLMVWTGAYVTVICMVIMPI